MERPKIALDLDGVVVDIEAEAKRMLRERFGHDVDWERPPHFSWRRIAGLSTPMLDALETLWTTPPAYEAAEPFPGAVGGVRRLSRLTDVQIVTSRPTVCSEATLSWLNRHGLGGLPVSCGVMDKAGLAAEWGVALAMEDAPHHLEAYAAAGITVLRFVAPYNEAAPGIPVWSWPMAVDVARAVLWLRETA